MLKTSFNGAATCSLRNVGEQLLVLRVDMELQWGRNLFVAECAPAAGAHRPPGRASMGPQLVRCGMMACSHRKHQHHMLQWGRNLFVAECVEYAVWVHADGRASMGPQLVRCGMLVKVGQAMEASCALQWGRNLFVAECMHTGRRYIMAAMLQWGRNLFVAEWKWR